MSEWKPVLLSLSSLTPPIAVEILPSGLTINRIFIQADGRTHDIVVGPENAQDHLHKKYTNTVVGRYTNRIPTGTHSVTKNGITSSLTTLANENPSVSLHGGPQGFDSVPWTPTLTSSSILFTAAELANLASSLSDSSTALFSLVSEDGDQGFPGKLYVEVLFTLVNGKPQEPVDGEWALGSIVIVYRAKLVGDEKVVTPINLTQHWGFNLDASLKDHQNPPSVADHTIDIKASGVVAVDSLALATGERILTTSDPVHTHTGERIGEGEAPAGGYDHFYLFTRRTSPPPPASAMFIPLSKLTSSFDLLKEILSGSDAPVVQLASAKSGLKLAFNTNQSGVQYYTNNFADGTGARKKIHGGSGEKGTNDGYKPLSAAFLEFHEPISAFLHPSLQKDTQTESNTVLAPGEVYNNWVKVDVTYHRPPE